MGVRDALRALRGVARFDRAEFLSRYVNKNARAITPGDITVAASRLGVTPAHIRMVRAVESGGKSFDAKGRPTILFEPHIFHRRTDGEWSPSGFSYAHWGDRPYPKDPDGRWTQMADAAAKNEAAALESASWGLFQIMGFHWKALGYASAQDFAEAMTASEGDHLDAVVRFIEANHLVRALKACIPGDADSCRKFARGYNGASYEKNNYHAKLAAALK